MQPSAAHTTSGSSAFATTARVAQSPSALRHASAMLRTSWVRSSWSRLRFNSTTTDGGSWVSIPGSHSSSHSSAARPAWRSSPRATTMPASMLAPSALVATAPSVRSASAMNRLVVVLPLVPLTTATRRRALSSLSRPRYTATANWPPMTLPDPMLARRDSPDRPEAAARQARARNPGGGGEGMAPGVVPAPGGVGTGERSGSCPPVTATCWHCLSGDPGWHRWLPQRVADGPP